MSDKTQTPAAEQYVRQSISGAAGKAEPATPTHTNVLIGAMQAAEIREREIARERAALLGSK